MNVWGCHVVEGVHLITLDTKVLRKGTWVNVRVSQMVPQYHALHGQAKKIAVIAAVEKIGYKILQEMKN